MNQKNKEWTALSDEEAVTVSGGDSESGYAISEGMRFNVRSCGDE